RGANSIAIGRIAKARGSGAGAPASDQDQCTEQAAEACVSRCGNAAGATAGTHTNTGRAAIRTGPRPAADLGQLARFRDVLADRAESVRHGPGRARREDPAEGHRCLQGAPAVMLETASEPCRSRQPDGRVAYLLAAERSAGGRTITDRRQRIRVGPGADADGNA